MDPGDAGRPPRAIFTLEDGTAAFLRDGAGPAREVALPPGADPERVAAAGGLGVAPTPEGALAVFDLRTDIERRQISLGRFDPSTITGLAISPEGDVAATVPVGDGDDVLLWARAGASRVRVLARGRRYSRVAVAGGRVAFVGGDGLRDGERVTIVDPATNRVVFRGPPASEITSLAFDGRNVAFSTPACALAGPARSRRTIPPGPCSRTDVAVSTVVPAVRDGRYRVRVACINAPARRCRVSATLRTRSGRRRRARARARVPVRRRARDRDSVRRARVTAAAHGSRDGPGRSLARRLRGVNSRRAGAGELRWVGRWFCHWRGAESGDAPPPRESRVVAPIGPQVITRARMSATRHSSARVEFVNAGVDKVDSREPSERQRATRSRASSCRAGSTTRLSRAP